MGGEVRRCDHGLEGLDGVALRVGVMVDEQAVKFILVGVGNVGLEDLLEFAEQNPVIGMVGLFHPFQRTGCVRVIELPVADLAQDQIGVVFGSLGIGLPVEVVDPMVEPLVDGAGIRHAIEGAFPEQVSEQNRLVAVADFAVLIRGLIEIPIGGRQLQRCQQKGDGRRDQPHDSLRAKLTGRRVPK